MESPAPRPHLHVSGEMLGQAISSVLPDRLSRAALVEAYDEEYDRCVVQLGTSHANLPKASCTECYRVLHFFKMPPPRSCYVTLMRRKLGLLIVEDEADWQLASNLLDLMKMTGSDFTNTFRLLSSFSMPSLPVGGEALSQGLLSPASDSSLASSSGHERASDNVLEAIMLGRAETDELVRLAAPRIPMAQLQMLSMLVHRDPALLHALGMSVQVGRCGKARGCFVSSEFNRPPTFIRWSENPPLFQVCNNGTIIKYC